MKPRSFPLSYYIIRNAKWSPTGADGQHGGTINVWLTVQTFIVWNLGFATSATDEA